MGALSAEVQKAKEARDKLQDQRKSVFVHYNVVMSMLANLYVGNYGAKKQNLTPLCEIPVRSSSALNVFSHI